MILWTTKLYIPREEDLIWDRYHIRDRGKNDDLADCWIIHGHTPTNYLMKLIDHAFLLEENDPGAIWYGKKCCIDAGAYSTGACSLLNLDTWQEEVFQVALSNVPY